MNPSARILFSSAVVALLALGLMLLVSSGCGSSSDLGDTGNPGTGNTGTGPGPTGTGGTVTNGSGNPGNAVPKDMEWAVKVQASDSWLQATAEKISAEFAYGLWKATEGQMYLRNQVLRNNSDDGDAVFQNLDKWTIDGGWMGNCYWGGPKYRLDLCGKCPNDSFLHEFCHGEFSKHNAEEYDCGICTMGMYMLGRKEQLNHYCDKSDCVTGTAHAAACWENWILKDRGNWTHTGRDPGGHPRCTVTIER